MRWLAYMVAFAALPVAPWLGHAATPMQTDTGKLVHWAGTEIQVGVEPGQASARVPVGSVEQAIDEAAAAWNALPEMRVKLVRASQPEMAAVKLRFCRTRWNRAEGLLGHSEFEARRDTGLVSAAVIEVNECDFSFVGPDEVAVGHMDLQAVLTHEFGHVLGLAHSADPEAVMFTSTGTVRQRRPTMDDRTGLAAIYGGVEAPTPAKVAPVRPEATPSPLSPELYTGGKDWPVPFELPWPLNAGNQMVKFVPTVLPLAPRPAATAAPVLRQASQAEIPAPKPRATRSHRRDPDAPVAQDMDWPTAPPLSESSAARPEQRVRDNIGRAKKAAPVSKP